MGQEDASWYEVLGVDPAVDATSLRRSYLRLARELHPDFHTGASAAVRARNERRMQEVNAAWAVLGDPGTRRAYDEHLRRDRQLRWTPGEVNPDFVPVDDLDDPIDPRDLPDIGVVGTEVPRWQQLLPVSAFAVAVGSFAVGLATSIRVFLALGVLAFLAAVAGFVLTPMLAVLRGYERDPDR